MSRADLLNSSALVGAASIRVALYGRYSSDQQNPKSVDAQFLICGEYSARQPNWQIVGEFRDEGISGASLARRPGIRELLDAAVQGKFDIVLAETMDRLSRDDADMPYIAKKLKFAGVKIFTVADGEITKLHVGMKGTMNSMFLDNLATQTHRGLEYAVTVEGKVIGRSYGYEKVREFDARGEPIRGKRRIKPDEAEIVVRILTEYANGRGPGEIAARLRDDGIPGPSGKPWATTTIRGDARRGTGIINNELYIGKIVWNRTTHPTHPDTGKHVSRANPREKWKTADAPELRIVSDKLWDRVKAKQKEVGEKYAAVIDGVRSYHASRAEALNATHRPKSFLSGLMVCGECDGLYTARGNNRFGCANHRHHGSWSNERTITREVIEERVLGALRRPFLEGVNVEKAMRELVAETDRLNRERLSSHDAARKLLVEVQNKLDHVMSAIERGAFSDSLNQRLRELEAAKKEAEARLESEKPTKVCIPGNFEEMLRRKIDNLPAALRSLEEADEAVMLVRELVNRVVIRPHPGQQRGVTLELHGCLGVLLDRITGQHENLSLSVESGARINRERHSIVLAI